ncbi:MAG: MerR family transcriptional regulator [Alphaproteobacteria bacterium]
MTAEYAIGEVARKTGVSVQLVRHYEAEGLIPAAPRTAGGRRVYDDRHLTRLTFVRHARALGFSLDDVRTLIDLQDHPQRDCHEADEIASNHLAQVEERLKALRAMRKELKRMVEECRHDRAANCRVIEVLSDHRLCLGAHEEPLKTTPLKTTKPL